MAGKKQSKQLGPREKLDVESPEQRDSRIASLLASRSGDTSQQSPATSPESPMARILEQPSRPGPLPRSALLDRVAAFLPMMAQSNTELLQRAVADPRSVIVDDPDGDDDEDEDEDEAEDKSHRAGGAGAAMQAGDEAEPEERERERRIVEMDVNLGVYGMMEGARPSGDLGPEVVLDEERIRQHIERYGGSTGDDEEEDMEDSSSSESSDDSDIGEAPIQEAKPSGTNAS